MENVLNTKIAKMISEGLAVYVPEKDAYYK